ncbi:MULTISPECIES: single-stranded DNA-binding protein [Streptomyces]|uniref:Single-stranded DNA-binding protein n=2 Tax=Streptomyces rimosus subsp. rimosus TaxID=132474 RepID=L8EF91_STRR1|nr:MULTISPECIES: single-stranded DNA-binding protein [Streptomyces]KOG67404.1 single-stranded DNA-binding protein [Kitasatospora aureofaciens]MYT46729.1 single-stranded DNA-binding protein [Streptomyces sp. SID5471]KEF08176.1 single-stranded DNA-binding protein [Streptomyces rimosus]KOT45689.1 single-stranded DNA-binding protein [Streptomyces rimosus subsp. rimosus]KOT46965.1 single-stranded DNA-binding protein [Streptomyces sp. NRRL WC-3701]
MSFGETPVTIIGNLTADPELKYTTGGQALARFTVASTPRTFDREANQWKDGTSTFFRCATWRALAEHVAESLTKGSRVVLSGRIRQHNWQTEQGENRSMLAVEVDEIGASLRFTTVTIEGKRTNGTAPADDPWNTAGNPAKTDEEPPF